MVRVCLKNTFLSFDEEDTGDEEAASPQHCLSQVSNSKAASPRSRSVDASPTQHNSSNEQPVSLGFYAEQMEKLNRLLDSPTPTRSPGSHSPPPEPKLKGHQSKGHRSAKTSPGGLHSFAAAATWGMGPSPQELRQLRARLEEVCQPRGGRTSEASSPLSRSSMRHAMSSNSVSTMAGENFEDAESFNQYLSAADRCDEPVEFDLTIEEDAAPPQGALNLSDTQAPTDAPAATKGSRARGRRGGRNSPPNKTGSQHSDGASPRSFASCESPASRHASPGQSSECGYTSPGSMFRRMSPLSCAGGGSQEYRHGHVPRSVDLAQEFMLKSSASSAPPTTLMVRNIPNRYTQRELITELEDMGFAGTFDFLYMPLDKGTMSNVGYAFVNFVDPVDAAECLELFQKYHFKRHRKISGKVAAASVAHIQGLEANLAHYENAAVNTAKLKQHRPVVMANISRKLTDFV